MVVMNWNNILLKNGLKNELDNLKIENEALRKIIEAYCEDEGYIPSRIADLYKKFVERQEPLDKELKRNKEEE